MTARLDIRPILEVLDRHGVAYIVIGSVAALARGASDVEPGDLDVVPDTDSANLARLATALAELRATASPETGAWQTDAAGEHHWVEDGVERPARPLDPDDPNTFDHSFLTPMGRLDVVPRIAGAHAELQTRASRLPIGGREAWVAHPLDVLAGITSARRPKDAPRVRHLRHAASTPMGSGIGFIGFRTGRFDEMVELFRDRIGLSIIRDAPGATWFRLGTDAELHVYAESDADHAFFTTGPVVGIRVADVDATRAALEADGLEMVTEVERTDAAAWCHFRAPDGTVLEIIGPATRPR